MKQEINLEEILFKSKYVDLTSEEKQQIKEGLIDFTFDDVLNAMKTACLETLELAASKARIGSKELDDTTWEVFVDKQLILNLKDKIK